MNLQNYKITGYAANVKDLPDQVTGRADWLKAFFDSRGDTEIKDAVNGMIETLLSAGGAAEIGGVTPPGVTPQPAPAEGEVPSVQAVLVGLYNYIGEKIIALGAGDMACAVYDPQEKREDVFAYAARGAAEAKEAAATAKLTADTAYTRALAALPLAGGTLTGALCATSSSNVRSVRNVIFSPTASWPAVWDEGDILAVYS